MSPFEFEVRKDESGRRLDVVMVSRVPGMSRARASALTAAGEVRVNGHRARKGVRVSEGDHVALDALPAPADFDALPDPELPLVVLHEASSFVVVDKPAGVPSHPLSPGEKGTMAGALVARYPEMRGVGYARREPGIVHRLDNDTSGVLLAARQASAFEVLRAQLKDGDIDKHYLALCAGRVDAPATIDRPIGKDRRDPRRVHVCSNAGETKRTRGLPACTDILHSEPKGDFSLVEVKANAARRHQIRAHLAAIGHPLAGDLLYGGPALPGLHRHFLHASEIAFRDPADLGRIRVVARLPSELADIIEQL